MLCLYVQAPFAVFRAFTAGSFRPTAPFITPSAAYGLLLNLAGIEMRAADDKRSPMTLIRKNLPTADIALGALSFPENHTVFQQLHNYPVGTSGAERAHETKGNKYNIVPARRSLLGNLRAYVCMRGSPELEQQVLGGIAGKRKRYGVPFLGDNNFFLDRIETKDYTELQAAYWYVRVQPNEETGISGDVVRLAVTIDRADMSRSVSHLYRPLQAPAEEIPELAWTTVRYS